MKTIVIIPDDLVDVIKRIAQRTRKTRSRLFIDALREYVARHSPDAIVEATDKALAGIGETDDPFVAVASSRRLEQSEW
jgi:predicted transcriptional regulator